MSNVGSGALTFTAPAAVTGAATFAAGLTSCGGGFTCAVIELGGVKCWGSNLWGQLGDGTKVNRPTPVAVAL